MTFARPSRSFVADLVLAAVYGIAAWFCLAFPRGGSPVALVWLPNALLVGVLIQSAGIRLRPIGFCTLSLVVAAALSAEL